MEDRKLIINISLNILKTHKQDLYKALLVSNRRKRLLDVAQVILHDATWPADRVDRALNLPSRPSSLQQLVDALYATRCSSGRKQSPVGVMPRSLVVIPRPASSHRLDF